jgi:hypothetical protein
MTQETLLHVTTLFSCFSQNSQLALFGGEEIGALRIPFDLSKVPWTLFQVGNLRRLSEKLALFRQLDWAFDLALC